MRLHEIQSIEISAPYDTTFRFIADRSNLPRWAEAFTSVEDDRARMRTSRGETEVALNIEQDARLGVIDWHMTFPDGAVAAANSRLTRGVDGQLVYTFVLNAPPVPLESLEGALK